MKKIITLMIFLILVLSLMACGDETNKETENTEATTEETEDTNVSTETESDTEEKPAVYGETYIPE